MRNNLLALIAKAEEALYRGKFRFTHKGVLKLSGMNLEKPEKLRKELEILLQSVKPKVTLGEPKVTHFNMYGRSISAHYYPISPPDAFLHSGGAEDPTVIAFHKVCDALTEAGFKKGTSKKKKKSDVQDIIGTLEKKLAKSNWEKEGITLSHGSGSIVGKPGSWVEAHKNGEKVGYAQFHHGNKGEMVPYNVQIHPDHQRKGIGTAMYSLAEEKSGRKIVPSKSQSPGAKALWSQPNRPFGNDFKKYKKEHPGTKKTPSDPMFSKSG